MDCSPSGFPLFMGFSRQVYWSGLPFSSPGDLPKPGIKPSFPVLSSFGFASFWSLPYWGLWELCVCVTASIIPLLFSLGWIWRVRTGKYLRRPDFDPWVGKIPWRREWQLTLVFLPGECHGQRSLAGYSLQGQKSWTWLKWLSTIINPRN